jgi:2-isopropylmalate synthase
VTLTPEEKLEIARQLDRLGVDTIEAGFPITSQGEFEACKMICREGLKAEISLLARVNRQDMDRAISCEPDLIHLFIATSDIHLQYKLKISREEAITRAVEGIEYVKAHGLPVEFSAEDATRTDLDFLVEFFKTVEDAGADRIDIPDTVGVAWPERIKEIVSRVNESVRLPISIHCHDDYGLATANTIAAVVAGARRIHVTINGLGERAGNAALEEVVMALHRLYGKKTAVNPKLIYETSRLVSRLTGVLVQPNKAIVGENAFAHESGIHTHGILNLPATYEPMEPELVGRTRTLQVGKHAGTHGVLAQLKELGLNPTKEQVRMIVAKAKEIADKGKTLTDSDLEAIARTIMGETPLEKRRVRLKDMVVVTGINLVPTASVKMEVEGVERVVAETGVGPVDAAVKAIQRAAGDYPKLTLKEYRLEAITGGTDALAEVLIKVEDEQGNLASARGAGVDVVVASVNAMIEAINRIAIKQGRGTQARWRGGTP